MATCPACGQDNPPRFRFCGACGTPLPPAPGPGPAAPRHRREERKTVTVLFCDLAGFTAASDHADPEDVGAMLRPYHARLRAEIEHLGGTLDKFIGDAVMAVFGAPAAHEDDPERAVHCALRILAAIEELNAARAPSAGRGSPSGARGARRPGLGLAVRIGVNTGEALVVLERSAETETVVGDVVNTASRLQGIAPVGAAVVGESTWRATRSRFEYEALDPVTVKGKAEPVAHWRVLGPASRTGVADEAGAGAPFVGRADELDRLEAAFEEVLTGRSVGRVTLVGTAGVGKSRLVAEFAERIEARPELIAWRQGRCLPYGDGISFWALGEIVKAQAGVGDGDDAARATSRLAAAVAAVVPDPADREWIGTELAGLLGLAAEPAGQPSGRDTDRVATFTAWRRFLEAVAAERPLILVVEDLHWADQPMAEFLDQLVAGAAPVPLLLLVTARPELAERHPAACAEGPGRALVRLGPLSDDETAALTGALLGRSVLPAEVQSLLVDRAGGNPLYAREFVRLLGDRGLLGSDRVLRAADVAGVPFPGTVQALIATRLDAVAPGTKALLQDAAVLGRVFLVDALGAVSGLPPAEVEAGLAVLADRELIAPTAPGQYTFSHALVRDVAYGQIPRQERAGRHRAAARWLLSVPGERADELAELVAHHLVAALELSRAGRAPAGELDELTAETRRALARAGDRTRDLDPGRANGYYTRALELYPDGHPERAGVLVKSARTEFQATGELAGVTAAYEEAIAALAAQGDRLSQGAAMERLAVVRWTQGDVQQSRRILAEAVELLEREPPSPELASVYAQMASDRTMAGAAREGLEWAGKALALAERLGDERLRLRALDARGVARCESGDLGGVGDLRAALAGGLESGASYDTAVVYNLLIEPVWLAEGPRAAMEICTEAQEFIERRGLTGAMAIWFSSSMLTVLFDLGEWERLLAEAHSIVAFERAQGARYVSVSAESYTAQVLCLRGRVAEARRLADGLLPDARAVDDLQALVPALVTAAVVREAAGDRAAAIAALDELGDVVGRRSGGHWYRSQYIADLARVAVAVGRPAHAAELAGAAWPEVARHRLGAATARAVLAEAEGRTAEAAALYDEAAGGWAAYGHKLEHGLALAGAARCLGPAGDGRARGAEEILRNLLTSASAVSAGGTSGFAPAS
jgi:class 3 adenylate cyclase